MKHKLIKATHKVKRKILLWVMNHNKIERFFHKFKWYRQVVINEAQYVLHEWCMEQANE